MEIKMIDPDKPNVRPAFTQEPISDQTQVSTPKWLMPALLIIVLFLGGYSGVLFKNSRSGSGLVGSNSNIPGLQADVPDSGVKAGDIFGSANEKAFNNSATGVLDKGGLNGEGTHKLLRPGGPSQTVYVTSSVIDLDQLVGHQITIWGETFKGQKAGWLMDVGRAKVETLNAPLPQ